MDPKELQRPEGFSADDWDRLSQPQRVEVVRIANDAAVHAQLEDFEASARHFAETGEGPWVEEL